MMNFATQDEYYLQSITLVHKLSWLIFMELLFVFGYLNAIYNKSKRTKYIQEDTLENIYENVNNLHNIYDGLSTRIEEMQSTLDEYLNRQDRDYYNSETESMVSDSNYKSDDTNNDVETNDDANSDDANSDDANSDDANSDDDCKNNDEINIRKRRRLRSD